MPPMEIKSRMMYDFKIPVETEDGEVATFNFSVKASSVEEARKRLKVQLEQIIKKI